jgi:two-component system, NarL family, invasion response regulator UvrY
MRKISSSAANLSLNIPLPVHFTRLKTSHLGGLDSCQPPDSPECQKLYAMVMKILLADPHPEVQSALKLVLNRIPQVTGLNEADSLVQLLSRCAQSCPDLILFDRDLVSPSRAHPHALADLVIVLRRLCPCSKVVVMSSRFEAEEEALAAGANGFISKTDPPDVVLTGIVRFLGNC